MSVCENGFPILLIIHLLVGGVGRRSGNRTVLAREPRDGRRRFDGADGIPVILDDLKNGAHRSKKSVRMERRASIGAGQSLNEIELNDQSPGLPLLPELRRTEGELKVYDGNHEKKNEQQREWVLTPEGCALARLGLTLEDDECAGGEW